MSENYVSIDEGVNLLCKEMYELYRIFSLSGKDKVSQSEKAEFFTEVHTQLKPVVGIFEEFIDKFIEQERADVGYTEKKIFITELYNAINELKNDGNSLFINSFITNGFHIYMSTTSLQETEIRGLEKVINNAFSVYNNDNLEIDTLEAYKIKTTVLGAMTIHHLHSTILTSAFKFIRQE